MKKLILFLTLFGALCWAQTPKSVQVCWTPEGGTQTCQTFQPDTVTLITLDLRPTPVQYVVVQPLPAYQVTAMQKQVDNQTYHMQQTDGTVVTRSRYSSIQDMLMQYLVRSIMVPALIANPPSGDDAGKTGLTAVATDLGAARTVAVIQ